MKTVMTVSIKGFNPETIIKKYKLEPNGDAHLFNSNNCFRRMTKYVPWDTGALATTVTIRPNSVTYNQPYARRQYYEHKGDGIRGRRWDEKMVANEKKQLTIELENYIKMVKGGK